MPIERNSSPTEGVVDTGNCQEGGDSSQTEGVVEPWQEPEKRDSGDEPRDSPHPKRWQILDGQKRPAQTGVSERTLKTQLLISLNKIRITPIIDSNLIQIYKRESTLPIRI